jgi:putative DNA primase/helicase
MKVEHTLVIDDVPELVYRRDKDRFRCVGLTGFDPDHIADLEIYQRVLVIERTGAAKLARAVEARMLEVMPEGTRVDYAVAPEPGVESYLSKDDDLSLADRFLTEHRRELRYVGDVERWIVWNRICWRGLYDSTGHGKAQAMLQRFLAKTGREKAAEIRKEAETKSEDDKAAAFKAARLVEARYRSSALLNAVWRQADVLAQDSDVVTLKQRDLNPDPGLLNCLSGIIDLRTGKIGPHDPEALCTAVCPYAYDPDDPAPAPTFTTYLKEAQPDPEIRAYLQRRAGLCAYGGQRSHVFPIDLGNDGRNGKGLLAQVTAHVLGDYAEIVRSEILLVTRTERHLTQIASLVHRRFVWVDETRSTRSLDGAQVKMLTGGAPLRANFMRRDEFTFTPVFTPVLTTNQMPKFEGSDRALGARLQICPWDVTFAGREDEDLLDRLKAEGEGILAWLVTGAVDYLSGTGLRPPEAVREMTAEERTEHDVVGRWLKEHLIESPGMRVYTDWLYDQFTGMGWTETPARPFAMRLSTWLGEQGWDVKKVQLNVDEKRWRGWEGIGFT